MTGTSGGRGKGMRPPGDSRFAPSLGKDGHIPRNFYAQETNSVSLEQKIFPTIVKGVTAEVIGVYPDGQKRVRYIFGPNAPQDDRVEAFIRHNNEVRLGIDIEKHTKRTAKEKGGSDKEKG